MSSPSSTARFSLRTAQKRPLLGVSRKNPVPAIFTMHAIFCMEGKHKKTNKLRRVLGEKSCREISSGRNYYKTPLCVREQLNAHLSKQVVLIRIPSRVGVSVINQQEPKKNLKPTHTGTLTKVELASLEYIRATFSHVVPFFILFP